MRFALLGCSAVCFVVIAVLFAKDGKLPDAGIAVGIALTFAVLANAR